MRNKDRVLHAAAVLLLGAALSGCGGGSSSSASVAPSTLTGTFGTIPTGGVAYSSASNSGVTTASGEFSYEPGEEITFRLGAMTLGAATGATRITEFDLAGLDTRATSRQEFFNYFVDTREFFALNQTVSMASLLQTLDQDSDLSNGVVIAPSVAARFDENHIILSRSYWTFRDNRRLREILYQAAAAGEMSARPIRVSALVLTTLFDFTVEQYATYERDDENDGVLDYQFNRTFDELGKVRTSVTDTDGDGVGNNSFFQQHLASARIERSASDDDFDGVDDRSTEYTYNEFGSLVEQVNFVDGELSSSKVQRWDDQGALVYRENFSVGQTVIERWLYTDGIRDTYESDVDGDGVTDRRDVFEFDERGEWIRRSSDRNMDGVFDRIETREFDTQTNMIRYQLDANNDGEFEQITTASFDAFHNQLSQRTEDDGELSNLTMRTYTDGLLRRFERDVDGDGVFDRTTVYEHNELGLPIRQTNLDDEGQPSYSVEKVFNASGQELEARIDNDGDGVVDAVHISIHEGSRLVAIEQDTDNDGEVDNVQRFLDWVELPLSSFL